MIIHNDGDDDDDDDDEDDDDDDDEPSVPLEQYRAWLGKILYPIFMKNHVLLEYSHLRFRFHNIVIEL